MVTDTVQQYTDEEVEAEQRDQKSDATFLSGFHFPSVEVI